jgi:hypothetical protein
MLKTFVHMLLAMATLAMLSPVVFANQVISDTEQLPALGQAVPNTGQASETLPTPAEASEETPLSGEIITDHSPFENDGWSSPSPRECCNPGCGCGCSHDGCCNCCSQGGCCSCCDACCDKTPGKIYFDAELMALRAHFGEEAVGKLAEKYEMSERFVIGTENANGIGGRVRYWTYDRETQNLQGGTDIRFDFDVTDFEGTTHFGTKHFDLLLAAGVRWAEIKIDTDGGRSRNDMPGATFALDLRGLICTDCQRGLQWHSVGGARWSIFGGDWEVGNGLIDDTRDDNITVMELYGGVECSKCCRGREMYARLVMETQNWRSDALGEETDVDSLSFIGPGVNMGMRF